MKPRVTSLCLIFLLAGATAMAVAPAFAQCTGENCPGGVCLLACPGGNCPNGQCPIQGDIFGSRSPSVSVGIRAVAKPRAAVVVQMRPVEPVKQYRAVVQIKAEVSATKIWGGTGVVVQWGRHPVILTATHVVRGAKRIIVKTADGPWIECKECRYDELFDQTVIQIPLADEASFTAAELAWGGEATPAVGTAVECVGWGPKLDSLAVSAGKVVSYDRPYKRGADGEPLRDRRGQPVVDTQAEPDWLAYSGSIRHGDSGGPIFDAHGRVVGVAWGCTSPIDTPTNDPNPTVRGTQGGMLHQMLRQTCGPWEEAIIEQTQTRVAPISAFPAQTPAPDKDPKMPFRREIVDEDRQLESGIGSIHAQIADLASRPAQGVAPVIVQPSQPTDLSPVLGLLQQQNATLLQIAQAQAEKQKAAAEPADLLGKIKADLANQKGEIKEALENPLVKLLLIAGGVIAVVLIVVKMHAQSGTPTPIQTMTQGIAAATAGTPIGTFTAGVAAADDRVVSQLQTQVSALDAKLHATALATPPASAVPPSVAAPNPTPAK